MDFEFNLARILHLLDHDLFPRFYLFVAYLIPQINLVLPFDFVGGPHKNGFFSFDPTFKKMCFVDYPDLFP